MQAAKTVLSVALAAGVLSGTGAAHADAPADDFLSPVDPGPRLTFMPIIGPGFRTIYDHRYQFNDVEQNISEVRTQLIGDWIFPYSEVSANIDIRLFLLTFGASVGYHNEWHLLQFDPNYKRDEAGRAFGRDLAGQRQEFGPAPADGGRAEIAGPFGFNDLTREARRVKDQSADVKSDQWAWYEGRLGFLAPAQNFMGVSTAAMRYEDRPDVSFDWANGTVMNGGWHLRWETYAFFRDPAIGFIGPAARVMNVPRNRLRTALGVQGVGETAPAGSACQRVPGLTACEEVREWEVQYGFIGGFRPNWVNSGDVLLTRWLTTFGMDDDELYGMHLMGIPVTFLFAYQVNVDL